MQPFPSNWMRCIETYGINHWVRPFQVVEALIPMRPGQVCIPPFRWRRSLSGGTEGG